MSNFSSDSNEDFSFESGINVPFEKDYENIKTNPNVIYEKYFDKVMKLINSLSYWKNFDKDELIQQSYIYFLEFCESYDPYYNGNFIPFDKYVFKNLIIKLRSHIQRFYVYKKREQPTEFSEYNTGSLTRNDILISEDKIFIEYLYSHINERQREILELSTQGFKQQEIGKMLKISQSRVSVIRRKTLELLKEIVDKDKLELELKEFEANKGNQ
jgi:RNA polymerase sigma factor (sigma-70 family)